VISKRTFSERRRDPRVSNNVPLKLCHEDGDMVTETCNISRSGAYCRVNKYIEPMTKLQVHLLLPIKKGDRNVTKKVSCEGVVVRVEPLDAGLYNIAIFFNEIKQRDADQIASYVGTYLKDGSTAQ
jgi:hypothetical protein